MLRSLRSLASRGLQTGAPTRQAKKFRSGRFQLEIESLEVRCLLDAASFYSFDGSGNNIANPTWGASGHRSTPPDACPVCQWISVRRRCRRIPVARLISNILNNQADPANPSQDIATVNQQSLSDFAYSFGQFMDHDMDLTLDNGASDPIPVPVGDPIGGPNDTPLAFNRSQTDPATGTGPGNPAQDINSITAYLDLSQVYGSDLATDNALRTFVGGLMKTSPGGLPPLDNTTYFTPAQLAVINASVGGMADNGPLPESDMFVTGDTRGNENVELTVLQTLFLDNHNRIAAELQQENPTWTDQQLFQEARKLNIAEYQSIIYNEWIPAVLGSQCAAGLHRLQSRTSMPASPTNFRPWRSASATACLAETWSGRATMARRSRPTCPWPRISSTRPSSTAKASRRRPIPSPD